MLKRIKPKIIKNILEKNLLNYSVSSRGDYTKLTNTHINNLLKICSGSTDPSLLKSASTDWLNTWSGNAPIILYPRKTKEISELLKYCSHEKIACVPQGGNTGLVGGGVPLYDEIIINTSKMDKIVQFDSNSGVLIAEAGCILQNLQEFVENEGRTMPLDLGAKGSCQIGGNVATNAGGLRLIRYGSLHGSVLGLEVVLPNGKVMNALNTQRKDNTGIDIKQLFIGSEGILGFITKVAIATPPLPKSQQVAFLAVKDKSQLSELLESVHSKVGETLSAFEVMDKSSLEAVLKHDSKAKNPINTKSDFYAILEISGSNADHDKEKLDDLLEYVMDKNIVLDGVVSQDTHQLSSIWSLRENIPEALIKTSGFLYKYDISLPQKHFYEIVDVIQERLGSLGIAHGYGHYGDGNIHLNISTESKSEKLEQQIESFLFKWISDREGSISAEHGIGQQKPNHLHFSKDEASIELMRMFKQQMDPFGILNPYKVIPKK